MILVTIYVDSVLQCAVQHKMTIDSVIRSLLVTMSRTTVVAISIQSFRHYIGRILACGIFTLKPLTE